MEWNVPRIWEGEDCYIIGGGPSMLNDFNIPNELIKKVRKNEESPSIFSPFLEKLHNKHVIGVNMAFKLGTWLDIMFFGDKGFFLKNQEDVLNYPKLRVSCAPHLRNHNLIKYLHRDRKKRTGLTEKTSNVVWNFNSGAAAINLAVHTGAKRIILLGFDLKSQDNKSHWHCLYKQRDEKNIQSAYNRHSVGFPQISRDAKKRGIKIINTSMDSAIEVFEKQSIKELL